MSTSALERTVDGKYRHEAFFYRGDDEFMDGTLGFIREALADDEPILVVLAADRIAALREELRDGGERVSFADMGAVGGNPADHPRVAGLSDRSTRGRDIGCAASESRSRSRGVPTSSPSVTVTKRS